MSTRYDFTIDQGATFSRVLIWTAGAKVLASGVASTDVLTATGVQLTNGNAVFVQIESGLAGLTTNTIYYVRDASGNTFKLAATSGGAAINFSSSGTLSFFRCLDLTGYTARMDFKAVGQATVSLTTASGLTLAADGSISVAISATATAAMGAAVYSYDLEIVSGSTVTRVCEGRATVSPNITT